MSDDGLRALRADAEWHGIYLSNPPTPLEIVVVRAHRLAAAWKHADEHPGDPHALDSIDYCEDGLREAIRNAEMSTDG